MAPRDSQSSSWGLAYVEEMSVPGLGRVSLPGPKMFLLPLDLGMSASASASKVLTIRYKNFLFRSWF